MTTTNQLVSEKQTSTQTQNLASTIDHRSETVVDDETVLPVKLHTFPKPWVDSMQSEHSERAFAVLENPSEIYSAIEEYGGGGVAYSKLIGSMKKGDFEDFMRLQKLFIKAQHDERLRVKRWIETGLARSIKNALIDNTSSFPVTTLEHVKQRLDAYEEIGIETPSMHETIETTIEALYDNDWENAFRVVEGLLSDIPETAHKPNTDIDIVVDLLARLWTLLFFQHEDEQGTLTDETVHHAIEKVVEITSVPFIPSRKIDGELEDYTMAEIMEEAESRSYEDVVKNNLYQYVFHNDTTQIDAFTAYLYLSGREIVEDQRHGAEKPTRARLAVAEKQFRFVRLLGESEIADLTEKEIAWAHSHEYVSRGAMYASGWIESQRENQPDPEFEKAATEYVHASELLIDHIPVRSMKYRSKAMRYSAKNAPRDSAIEIHKQAVKFLITQASEVDETYFTSAVQDRIRYHSFQKHKHSLDKAYIEGEYDKVNHHYYECVGMEESIDLPLRTHKIEQKHLTAQGKRAEQEQDYETALAAYEQISRGKAFVTNRRVLIDMKKALINDEYDTFESLLGEMTGTHKLIDLAGHIILGKYPDGGFPLMDKIDNKALPSGESTRPVKIQEHAIKQIVNTDNFAGMHDETIGRLFYACRQALTAPVSERELYRNVVLDVFMEL